MRIFILITAMFVFSDTLSADLDVTGNADAEEMRRLLLETMSPVFPCLYNQTQAGMPDDQARSYCICKNRSGVEAGLRQLQDLRDKHPEWEGKALELVYIEDDGSKTTLGFGYEQISQIEDSLKTADQECL